MPEHQKSEYIHYPPFRPSLRGCVGRDTRLAAAVYTCSCEALWSISENIYRSLIYKDCDTPLCELFNELAEADLERFRLLEELFIALCENEKSKSPCCSNHRRTPATSRCQHSHIQSALWERRRNIDCFEALMRRTEDRVVRSVFAKILTLEESFCRRLESLCKE